MAYPDLFFKDKDFRNEFCEHMFRLDDTFPKDMDAFQKRFQVKYVMTSQVPLQAMQIPFARGCYIYGGTQAVLAWIDTVDTMLHWRRTLGRDGDFPPISIEITNCTGLKFDTAQKEYDCNVTWTDKASTSMEPQSPFSIPSAAWVKTFPLVYFEALSNKTMKIRFEGDTLTFAKHFGAMKIPGRYEDDSGRGLSTAELEDADVKKQASYVRIIKEIDVTEEQLNAFLLSVLAEKVYKGTLIIVKWKGDFNPGDGVTKFKTQVLALKNVRVLNA